jgi:enamine deaminase RidA (YjgF/YER057c/UK114 family)
MPTPLERLQAAGLTLPAPAKPGGRYQAVRVLAPMVSVAIQFPFDQRGELVATGRLGQEVSTAQGARAAQACALMTLAQLQHAVGLDRLAGILDFTMYVQSADGWSEFPAVLDGASTALLTALEERGQHSRAPIGAHRLPLNAPVAMVTRAMLSM